MRRAVSDVKQRAKFWTPYDQYRDRMGQRFTILRELTDQEKDPEVGRMYKIRFADGTEIDAWPEELYHGVIDGGVKQFKKGR